MDKITTAVLQAVTPFKQVQELEQTFMQVYDHFVHNPADLLTNNHPYLMGEVFYYFGFFQESDRYKNEVKGESAYICFSRCIAPENGETEKDITTRTFAAAKLLMYLSERRNYFITLFEKVVEKCSRQREIKCGDKEFHRQVSDSIDHVRVYLRSIVMGNSGNNIVLPHNENLQLQEIQQTLDASEARVKEGQSLHERAIHIITSAIEAQSN